MELRGIGELIGELRRERGISQKTLSQGLLPLKDLSLVELGNLQPGTFMLDYLISRLGKSSDKLEYTIGEEEYFFCVLRTEIEKALRQGAFDLVEEELKEYEKILGKKDILHWQYIELIRAVLCRKEPEKSCEWLERALKRTKVEPMQETLWEQALGRYEIMLLVLWGEQQQGKVDTIAFLKKEWSF